MHPSDEHQSVGRAWLRRGFSCALWVDPPGQVWNDFVHDVDEVVHLLEGDLLFELDGHSIRLRPGEELLIGQGRRHTVRNLGDSTARWLYGYRLAPAEDQSSQA